MPTPAERIAVADPVAQLQWLTRERELSIAEGDWQAAQKTERRRWLVANELFSNPRVLEEYPQLRSVLEEVIATDKRTLESARQRQRSVGSDMSALRRGRQAADAYQSEAGDQRLR